jgi:hypothetical protein
VCFLPESLPRSGLLRPAHLELRQTTPDTHDVLWKVPALGDRRLGLDVRFPADAKELSEPHGFFSDNAYIARRRVQCQGGLDGQTILVSDFAQRAGEAESVQHDCTETKRSMLIDCRTLPHGKGRNPAHEDPMRVLTGILADVQLRT